MLHRIQLKNFRSCEDTVVEDIGQLVALIGHNGAGKSSILQGISIAAGIGASLTQVNLVPLAPLLVGKPFSAELDFECAGSKYRYFVQFGVAPPVSRPSYIESLSRMDGQNLQPLVDRSGAEVKIRDRQESIKIGDFAPCLAALATLLPATDQVVAALRTIVKFLSTVRYYPIDEPATRVGGGQPLLGSQYNQWLTNFESTGNPGESVLPRLVYMSEKRKEDFEILKSWLGHKKLGLIDDIRIHTVGRPVAEASGSSTAAENQFYFVNFVPCRGSDREESPVLAEWLSAGTRRVLKMLVSVIFDGSAVMLLEQPEDSLHQGLTKKLIGLIQTNVDSQIILSSHSSALLNKLEPENIRIVSLHEGYTTARPLTEREREAAVKFLNAEGPFYDFLEPLQ
jgi:energy-coupling factor transporter ATP-binding protein EcfA2